MRLASAVAVVFGEAEQPTNAQDRPNVTQPRVTCLKFMSESIQNGKITAKSRESALRRAECSVLWELQ